jgi:probable F420-dependent oxidoreductase
MKAMFETFQHGGKPAYFEGEHYQFTSMPPFFNPGPIEHPHVPIYIAAVNRYMLRLAGELCDGLRLHPIATFGYTKGVVLPMVEAGATKSGRRRSDIDVVGAPFLAIAKDDAGVEVVKKAMKQRIAFYGSTRTYHAVFDFHGWQDVGLQLHKMSLENRWQDMPALVTDEMLEQFSIIGTYDELVPRLKQRCSDIFNTILIDLPPDLLADQDRVKEIIAQLRA